MATVQLRSREVQEFERKLSEGLGIDQSVGKAGSLCVEYQGGQDVTVTWECIKVVPLEEYNKIFTEAQA